MYDGTESLPSRHNNERIDPDVGIGYSCQNMYEHGWRYDSQDSLGGDDLEW